MITIEDVKKYEQINKDLSILCKKHAEKNLEYWQHYQGWNIEGDNIVIVYTFEEFCSNTEMCTEFGEYNLSIEDFLKECKDLI